MNNFCQFQFICPGYFSHEWNEFTERAYASNHVRAAGDPDFQTEKAALRRIPCLHCQNGFCQNQISNHFQAKVVA